MFAGAGLLFFLLIGLLPFSLAQVNLFAGNPLLQGATSYTFTIQILTKIKPTSCYVTSEDISQCRRKRGIVERPELIQFDDFIISPSAVLGIEATAAPDVFHYSNSKSLLSSLNEDMEHRTSQNLFRQLVANGRNNLFTVGNCGQSVVNFSQFLQCLGLNAQDTSTLTATFTEIKTLSIGFTTFIIAGCTPAGFPYPTCPPRSASNTNLLGGLLGTVTNVLNNLLPSPIESIVDPILAPIVNVVSALPLPGQGSLLGGLLSGGTGNIPVIEGLLPGQGSTGGLLGGLLSGGTGSIPVVGGLLSGGTGNIPVVGGLLSGGTGNIPVVGELLSGGTGSIPVVGGLLSGGTGNIPVVGELLSGGTGSIPVVGGLLSGQGGTGGLGGLLLGLGGLPILGGGGVLGDGSQPLVPLSYRYPYE